MLFSELLHLPIDRLRFVCFMLLLTGHDYEINFVHFVAYFVRFVCRLLADKVTMCVTLILTSAPKFLWLVVCFDK